MHLDRFRGSRMEGLQSTFPPHDACGKPDRAPRAQEGGWTKRDDHRFFITPRGLDYLDLCKAIISQVNPSAPPPLTRANTKECGVQVNAKVDKFIQCSLGPKTLFCRGGDRRDGSGSPRSPDLSEPDGRATCRTPPVSHLRFSRPVSIYSPVFDRRVYRKKVWEKGGSGGEAERTEPDKKAAETDPRCEETGKDSETAFHRSSEEGSNFQFLEQRYGFFHCKKCNIRWESAYVWCVSGTSKVYYKQLCRKCQVGFNPYRVESIICKGCSLASCSCEKKQRHLNMKRPHRQDLCCRCKGMRLSCDTTYSFKYIV